MTPMPWIEITIQTSADEAERYEQALLDAGALSVTIADAADEPVLEPAPGETPLWSHSRITGLFEDDIDLDALETRLHHSLQMEKLPEMQVQTLEDQDWTRTWMDHFQPMSFGQRLWVCPDGISPPEANAVNLIMDPGLAFGTGTHPTTAMCLEWLDEHDVNGQSVLDYGCGSGILAIGALLLGAKTAYCVDNDPQALIATYDNAKKNRVTDKIETYLPDDYPRTRVDLCLANILAGPLVELAPKLASYVKPGGQIVLSGILSQQSDEVQQAYAQWFDMQPVTIKEDWARLQGVRQDS